MPPTITAVGPESYDVRDNAGTRTIFEQSIRWEIVPDCSGMLVQRIQRDAKLQFAELPEELEALRLPLGRKYRVEHEDYWECWLVIDGQAFPFRAGAQVVMLGGNNLLARDNYVQSLVWGDAKPSDVRVEPAIRAKRDTPGSIHDVYSVTVPGALGGRWKGTWKLQGTVYFLEFDDPWLKKFSLTGRSEAITSAGRLFALDSARLPAPPTVEPLLLRRVAGSFEQAGPFDKLKSQPRRVEHWNFQHPTEAPPGLMALWSPPNKVAA